MLMKSTIYLSLVLLLTGFGKCDYQILDKVSQNELGKNILDFISLKLDQNSDSEKTALKQRKTEIYSFLKEMEQILIDSQKALNEEKNVKDSTCSAEQKDLINKSLEITNELNKMKNQVSFEEKHFAYIEENKSKIEMKSKILNDYQNFNNWIKTRLLKIFQEKTRLSEKLNSALFSLLDRTDENNDSLKKEELPHKWAAFMKFFSEMLTLNNNDGTTRDLLKQVKKEIKTDIEFNEKLSDSASLFYEKQKHSLDLELAESENELQIIEKEIESHKADYANINRVYENMNNQKENIIKIIDLNKNQCMNEVVLLKKKIEEINSQFSPIKILIEYSNQSFDKLIKYLNQLEEEF